MSVPDAYERSRACPVLHVDMDAFYASVALRDRPDLQDTPVFVGGGHRGVVLSANYLARAHGVRSAMPGSRALRLCPDAVVLKPDHAAFATVSAAVMETFRQVTPLVEGVSMDEAFLDVSGAGRLLGTPLAIAEQLRARIADEQRITCSVGVAATVSVAKLASTRAKPDGVRVVAPDEVAAFLHHRDVGDLHGVGEKTRDRLRRRGYLTVGDLARTEVEVLRRDLGEHLGPHLHTLAWGADRRQVRSRHAPVFTGVTHDPDKSMGAHSTFGRDTAERAVVLRELLRLTTSVTGRMRTAGVAGRTVALTVRFSDFTTLTRSRTLGEATDVTQEVFAAVVALHDALGLRGDTLRLVGVRVEGLRARAGIHHQHVLGEREVGWAEADRAVDRATRRFGSAAVRPASLLGGGVNSPVSLPPVERPA